MKIEIMIDSAVSEPQITIRTDRMTEELERVVRLLEAGAPSSVLGGFRDGEMTLLEADRIVRIYAASGAVTAVTDRGEYDLRLRLYELEERLDRSFVRISHSELVNLRRVESFDLSLAGTICIRLQNGETAYASRRYVARIKQVLGI